MTATPETLVDRVGRYLARKLNQPSPGVRPFTHANVEALRRSLQPGDVLLVEGNTRVSGVIKYLTQSTWSHSALYVGDAVGQPTRTGESLTLIEVNLGEGCIAAPLSKYELYNTRICRPSGLTVQDRARLVDFMVGSIGKRYDVKNITDLLRFFLPRPPVPARWRRRLLAFGSGDPTRAICSSLIAQAFAPHPLPDPAGDRPELSRRHAGALAAQRDPAHPAPFALCTARLRPVAVLPYRQADAGDRVRLPQVEMVGSAGAGGFGGLAAAIGRAKP